MEQTKPTIAISIANQQEMLELDYSRMKTVARSVLEGEKVKKAKVTIACMSDSSIQALNKRFLQHDAPTDVISFPYEESKSNLQGELAVSTETASRSAQERGYSPTDELLLYIVHGLLHLCGYDDLDETARVTMRKREGYYLETLGIQAVPVE